MRQTITLLFHVGFGKTATTWMQKQIFSKIALNEDNCIYLGKLGDDEMMLDERFHKLHYELFNSLNELKRYRSKNSTILVNSYAEVISDKITKKFNAIDHAGGGNVILSNESIAGYGGYNAELNMFLLKMVIERVRKNLGEKYNLEEKIFLTFREQASLLQSFFAYDYYHQSDKFKTLEKFIKYGISHHHNDIFGSLWIDEIIVFMGEIFGEENVLFVPYELLKKDKNEFLRQTVVSLGLISDNKIEMYGGSKKNNTNKGQESGSNLLIDMPRLKKNIIGLSQYGYLIPQFARAFVKYIYIYIY